MRVVIVSDVRLYREGLAEALAHRPGLEIVGLAATADAAWTLVCEATPDVVLLDSATPSGRPLTAQVFDSSHDCHVVAIGLSEVESDVVAWARVGISAFVTRDRPVEDLVSTLEEVMDAEWSATPRTVSLLLRHLARSARGGGGGASSPGHLTAREYQVGQLIARGMSNKEIARELGIAVATVKNHVHAVLQKLSCTRRGQAAARLRREDPTSGPPLRRRPRAASGQ